MEEAQLFISGLTVNAEAVANRGIQAEFVTRLRTLLDEIRTSENTCKISKSTWMEETAHRNEKMEELEDLITEARKVVKLALPKESWRAFGIDDRR